MFSLRWISFYWIFLFHFFQIYFALMSLNWGVIWGGSPPRPNVLRLFLSNAEHYVTQSGVKLPPVEKKTNNSHKIFCLVWRKQFRETDWLPYWGNSGPLQSGYFGGNDPLKKKAGNQRLGGSGQGGGLKGGLSRKPQNNWRETQNCSSVFFVCFFFGGGGGGSVLH